MRLETKHIVVRDFLQSDAEDLYRIVREEEIMRFMPDFSNGKQSPADYLDYINWHQTQKDSTDVYENKRYVIALKESDEMIGMVGMGLEETLNEVEVAYFMSKRYQRKGYTQEAVDALVNWCFKVSDLKYLILTIDGANRASYELAKKCGFEYFEKRIPISHQQPNMESDYYFYFRKYRVELKNRELEHVIQFHEASKDEELQTLFPFQNQSLEEVITLFEETKLPRAKSFGQTIYMNHRYIGDVWMYAYDEEEGSCFISLVIFDKAYWHQGIGGTALEQFIAVIKTQYQLKKISAFTYEFNVASQKVLEKVGFKCLEKFEEDGILSLYFENVCG